MLIKKILTFSIILLFIGVGIQPVFAVNPKVSDETVEITVSRYKADGTVEKTKVILSKEKALEFNEKYRNIDDSEKRFLLLKEYGLIPEEVTREQLQQEMLNLANELGIPEEKKNSISKRFANKGDNWRVIGINFLNEISGFSFQLLNLPIGLSLIIGLINWLFYWEYGIPSADLLYIALYIAGFYSFDFGILPDFHTFGAGFFALLGFIGYVMSIPFLSFMAFIIGFSVASLAIPAVMGHPSI